MIGSSRLPRYRTIKSYLRVIAIQELEISGKYKELISTPNNLQDFKNPQKSNSLCLKLMLRLKTHIKLAEGRGNLQQESV